MKRIAIFCDGTWNRSDAPHPTNVMRLAKATMRVTPDGVTQQVIYVAGVGSGRGTTWLSQAIDRLGGGAFGWGLNANIEEAYWHLAFNYELGDQIYIFGFSRGAFTARSLAGLIRSCGIPSQDNIGRIPGAMAQYQARGEDSHPDAPASLAFRRGFSPRSSTSDAEVQDRLRHNLTSELLKIRYLGVWDTVGSLGVPDQLGVSKLFNRKYKFHDQALSRSVVSARHAVSVDERRRNFPPTVWDNLEDLNHQRGALTDEPYQQQWFPGDHGSVGGGGNIVGLSSETLRWVAQGAQAEGLVFTDPMLQRDFDQIEVVGTPLRNTTLQLSGLGTVLALSTMDRPPPRHQGEVSDAAVTRMAQDERYRPRPLKDFVPKKKKRKAARR